MRAQSAKSRCNQCMRYRCRYCGGERICQHNRIRSRCKTCKADKNDSMRDPGLEQL